MAIFVKTEQPVTNTDLDEVQRKFGFSFPVEFRDHYLKQNGGRPRNSLYEKDDTVFVVSAFFPIKYGNCLFEDVVRDLKEQEAFPKYLVPFADDPGGDHYCFSVREKDAGSIWIFRWDYYDDPKRAVEFLAPSLNEFIESMAGEVL